MSLTNFQVFNQYAYSAMLELITQQIALFNAATKGGITLRSAANQGDYADTALYSRISGLVRRRNAYGSGAVGHKELAMLLATTVKVAAGTAPVDIDQHWWTWIQRSPEEAGVVLGKQLAEDTLQDMLNTALKAFVAATTNVGATVVYDGTGGTPTLNTLNAGARLFGDRAQDIACWLMHSKSMFDIFDVSLTNTAKLFDFGTVKVIHDGFGRPFVVSDAPDLAYTSSGAKYHIAGLVPGGILVEQNNDFFDNTQVNNGDENIGRTYQAQWTYNLGLKGYAWDKTSGGASPSNSALGTGTNWDKFATSVKDVSGILVNVQ